MYENVCYSSFLIQNEINEGWFINADDTGNIKRERSL